MVQRSRQAVSLSYTVRVTPKLSTAFTCKVFFRARNGGNKSVVFRSLYLSWLACCMCAKKRHVLCATSEKRNSLFVHPCIVTKYAVSHACPHKKKSTFLSGRAHTMKRKNSSILQTSKKKSRLRRKRNAQGLHDDSHRRRQKKN